VSYPKDSVPPNVLWEIKGDTLQLRSSKEYNTLNVSIHNKQTLKLEVNDAHILMHDIAIDTLQILASRARMNGFRNTSIKMLYANLSNSNFNAYNGTFNVVNAELDKSNLTIQRKVQSITGNAMNHSDARFKKTNKINMTFDDNSTLRFYP
jgi:hypothetical protein